MTKRARRRNGKLLAFDVFNCHDPDNKWLVFARRRDRAKSLGKAAFPGIPYNDIRATRGSKSFDWHAQQHGKAGLVTSNQSLPDGVIYYQEAPTKAKSPTLTAPPPAVLGGNRPHNSHFGGWRSETVAIRSPEEAKNGGVIGKLLAKLFG